MNPVHFSSASEDWATPRDLAAQLVEEFGITLDVCATAENTVAPYYFTKQADGLKQDWTCVGLKGAIFVNPPYGKGIAAWIDKAAETAKAGTTVVCLLPARTDTRWFHRNIWNFETQEPRADVRVRFLPGRLKFGNSKNSAPFPSMIVVFG